MTSTPAAFEPEELLAALVEAGVQFVVIGQAAAILHGFPGVTVNLDLTPRADIENAERLVEALDALDGRHAPARPGDPEGGRANERDFLGWRDVRHFVTRAGLLDVVPAPAELEGYEQLAQRATVMELAGGRVLVAALDDVIASKEAAGRPKDRAVLPALRQLRGPR